MFRNKFIEVFEFCRSLLSISSISSVVLLLSVFTLGYYQDYNNKAFASTTEGQNSNAAISITIPKGAANPEVDITNLAPRQWYIPPQITINEQELVNWTNKDTEAHTVTSGRGAGIESLLTNKQGKVTGIFDSGLFKAGESWSYNFTKAGTYSYFCTIHPWMEGMVMVVEEEKEQAQKVNLPDYPVDASGNRLDIFPVHTLTNDQKYDIDLSWDPKTIVTGKPVNFIIDFFDPHTNKRLHLLPYDFVILKNGTEIDRVSNDLSEVGTDIQKAVFSEPGSIIIGIENVGDTSAYTRFNTLVYDNSEESKDSIQDASSTTTTTGVISSQSSPLSRLISPLTLVYITYAIIMGIPAAVAVMVILFRKGVI